MIDIILVGLVVLLSFKGYFNGFIRELVGFVGLIGGIFVASRLSHAVGYSIGKLINVDNVALLNLIGFLVVLVLVWGGISFVATVFSGLRSEPHSYITRILGMAVAGLKYFLILSMIVASLFNNKLIRDNLGGNISKSRLYPTFNSIGSQLINLTTTLNQKNLIKVSK